MYIKQLTNEEFNQFRNSFPIKSIYQTVEYSFVMNHHGFDSFILGLIDENDNIIAASIILVQKQKKFRFAYAPRGFLIDYRDFNLLKEFTELLKKYLSKLGIISIKISPLIIKNIYDKKYDVTENNQYFNVIYNNLISLGYKEVHYEEPFNSLKPNYEGIIDIDKPYYILFKNIAKEYRTKIRGADKNGIKVFKSENLEYLYLQTKKKYAKDLEYFKDCYKYFSKNNNIEFYYTKLDTKEYLKIKNKELQAQEKLVNYYNESLLTNSKHVKLKMEADTNYNICKKKLVEATKLLNDNPDGIITSSALIIKDYDEVYLFMDGYDPKYKNLNSKHLLIWKLIESYSNAGYKKFNLGGMEKLDSKNNKYVGLNNFKLGFDARVYEYIGDLELICNNATYFLIKNSRLKNILK